MNDHKTSIGALAAGAARWWVVFTFAFFLTFPLWARPLLWLLGAILGGLNDFGSGY